VVYITIDIHIIDWKDRIESLNWFLDLSQKYGQHLCQHKLCNKFLDVVMKLMSDSNSKVAIAATCAFAEMIPMIKIALQNSAVNVWGGVFTVLSSSNMQVRQNSEVVFQLLCQELDLNYSVQPLCHSITLMYLYLDIIYGHQKSKGVALNMLAGSDIQLYTLHYHI
jgi:hypothetical protein